MLWPDFTAESRASCCCWGPGGTPVWNPGRYASAVLLLALYLGCLIVLDPTNPVILVPALLYGFLVNPSFYLWLGLALLRGRST